MSHGGDLFAVRESMTSQPTFEVALRGYDKRQVDRYVAQVDGQISHLAAERDAALGQVQGLVSQLQHVQAELTDLHQRPPQVDRASFRDLGPMVDQILALAEKQAEAISGGAAQRAAELRGDAEKSLADAREQATGMLRDLEAELSARRTEAEKYYEEQRAAVDRDVTEQRAAVEAEMARQRTASEQHSAALVAEAQQYSTDLRQRADEQDSAHQQQLNAVQEEVRARRQALAQLQSEMDNAQQRLAQWRQEGATVEHEVAQLQQRLGEAREDLSAELSRLEEARTAADSADRHAKDVRARVQREAKRVADLAAAAVMAAAAGGVTGEYPKIMPPRPVADPVGPVVEHPAEPTVMMVPAEGHATEQTVLVPTDEPTVMTALAGVPVPDPRQPPAPDAPDTDATTPVPIVLAPRHQLP
jgi:peptidoglycan DL-endopeptidase RipA